MKRRFPVVLVAAFALGAFTAGAQSVLAPLAAAAQPGPPPPDGNGPSPEMRAKMDAMRAQSKADAFGALSPDHRAKVQAIVAQVSAGSLEPRDAVAQIDALLTPDERQSVEAVAEKSRDQMRAAFAGPGGPPPGGPPPAGAPAPVGSPPSYVAPGSSVVPPNGPPPEGGPAMHGHWHRPTAGGFLLRLSMAPDAMHGMRGPRPVPSASP